MKTVEQLKAQFTQEWTQREEQARGVMLTNLAILTVGIAIVFALLSLA